jgi:hypothetical protein
MGGCTAYIALEMVTARTRLAARDVPGRTGGMP